MKNWQTVKLGDITNIVYGKGLSTKELLPKGYPVFGANGVIGFYDKYLYEDSKVLLSCRGANSGKINISPEKSYITNNSLVVEIKNQKKLNKKYLFYSLTFTKKSKLVTGTAQPQVTINNAIELEIHLPPLSEQKKIVKKIEKLFTELDIGVASLKKVKEQIKLYRQSVLSAAFSGRLGRDKSRLVPTDEQTGNEHLRDRQAVGKNEHLPYKQVVKMVAEPKITYKDNGLPKGWKWVKFIDFCKLQRGYDLPLKNIVKGKYPVITSSGIKGYHNEYRTKGPCLITGRSGGVGNIHFLKVDKYWPHNTVLFVKDFCNNSPEYMYYFFQQFNFKSFSASTAVPTLDRKQLYNEPVKVPPYEEQTKIVEEIEKRFSEADNIKKVIDESLNKAENLRQSILKKAFEGRLV